MPTQSEFFRRIEMMIAKADRAVDKAEALLKEKTKDRDALVRLIEKEKP